MKAGSDLQDTGHTTADLDPPLGWLGNPTENFQERALAGAVAANDTDNLAFIDPETNVFQCPELLLTVETSAWIANPSERSSQTVDYCVAEGIALFLGSSNNVFFTQPVDF